MIIDTFSFRRVLVSLETQEQSLRQQRDCITVIAARQRGRIRILPTHYFLNGCVYFLTWHYCLPVGCVLAALKVVRLGLYFSIAELSTYLDQYLFATMSVCREEGTTGFVFNRFGQKVVTLKAIDYRSLRSGVHHPEGYPRWYILTRMCMRPSNLRLRPPIDRDETEML